MAASKVLASRRIQVAAAAGGVVGLAVVLAFGPLVRLEANRAAANLGAELHVERVSPAWGGVVLRDVDVTVADVPAAKVHLDEVRVGVLGGRTVALRGGLVSLTGSREEVVRQVEAWRAKHAARGSGGGGGGGRRTEFEGISVAWQNDATNPTETMATADLRIERSDGGVRIEAESAKLVTGLAAVEVARPRLALVRRDGGAYRVHELAADRVEAAFELPAPPRAAPEVEDPGKDAEPPLPAGPPAGSGRARRKGAADARKGAAADARKGAADAKGDAHKGRAGDAGKGDAGKGDTAKGDAGKGDAADPGKTADAGKTPAADDAPEKAGRGARLRDELVRVAHAVDAGLEDGARVHLAGVHARIKRGDDSLNLGPGALDVRRAGGRLEVELSPELSGSPGAEAPPRASGTPGASGTSGAAGAPSAAPTAAAKPGAAPAGDQALTFHLSVPLGATPEEVVADVNGGPIGLAALGIRDGDFGLFDVGKASLVTRSHVVLSADGHALSIDGEGKLHQLSIRSAALSDEPVAGIELAWRAKAELDLDGRRVKVDDAEVDLGAMRLSARGLYERVGDARRVSASFEMPLTGCQALLDSAPRGLVPKLKGMRMAGSFSIKGTARFDTANLDRTYKVDWDAANSCRVTDAPPDIHVDRFRHPFRRTVYSPDGKPSEVEAGPETPEWVAGSRISKFMEVAVQTTEDGGFMRHHGFDHEAIKNSIRENLRQMKFVRGASTISMQLAKNVYLDRTKNVSRKLQEAILTMYLEQELTKEQILELYLNVVEFGPMVYGIGPAARYYFSTSAADLSLGQALYISSIMPNPKAQHFGAGGAVGQGWMSYLRKLMRIANDRHRITDDELEEGLRESLVRGSPPQRSPRSRDGAVDEEQPAGDPEWVAP